MNERIRVLSAFAKSFAIAEAIHLSRVHNRTLSLDEIGEIHDKKFAELIVRECIAIAEHFSDGNEKDRFGRTLYHYRADIGKEIEQYFSMS
jgi:hypothetical protein